MATKQTLSGADGIKMNIRRFQSNWTLKKAVALQRVAEKVLARSNEYVPKDTEDLMESGHVVTSVAGQSVSIVYDSAYAVPVHEHLSEHSPHSWVVAESEGKGIHWSEPGTGPRFLERAWMEEGATYLQDLGEDLRVDRVGI